MAQETGMLNQRQHAIFVPDNGLMMNLKKMKMLVVKIVVQVINNESKHRIDVNQAMNDVKNRFKEAYDCGCN